MYKSAHELQLMQRASDITISAYRDTHAKITAGMTPADISTLMTAAMTGLGGSVDSPLILLGEASAYPRFQPAAGRSRG
jgi:Xaa-Pro dipeptidase